MRTYYIFQINKYFSYFYKKSPYKLFKMTEELYYFQKYDILLTRKICEKFILPFNKKQINEYIYSINKTSKSYYRDNNTHILNNGKYNKLISNNNFLILVTNDIYSIFLNDISSNYNNIFICDFKNKDYFWLDSINKDRQNNLSLV